MPHSDEHVNILVSTLERKPELGMASNVFGFLLSSTDLLAMKGARNAVMLWSLQKA